MNGTEKQIAYANSLKSTFVQSYQMEIDVNADVPEYVEELTQAVEFVTSYNGDAGKFINRFKTMGNEPDFFAARSAYRKFAMDERIRNMK